MESKSSFDDLPEVLVMEVLSWLSAKTLIRSTTVCKVWYSIIKTASFISLHQSRSVSDPSRYYIFLTNDTAYSFGLVKDNHLLTSSCPEHVFFLSDLCPKDFVGACKGLLCFRDDSRYGDNIYLVNPFIRKHMKLDLKSSCYADLVDGMQNFCVGKQIGFGYSEIEEDYKVLQIITPGRYEKSSLKTGQWKSLDISIDFNLDLMSFNPPICVLGCLYWSIERYGEDKEYLLCFDLKDEVFRKIEFPKTFHKLSRFHHHHKILNKSNSLVVVLYEDPFTSGRYERRMRVFIPPPPETKIWLLVLEKNLNGQDAQWRQLSYKCSRAGFDSRDFDFGPNDRSLNALGFGIDGKLIFEVYPETSNDSPETP